MTSPITISGFIFPVLADRADAARYFAGSMRGATWLALADAVQDIALVNATMMLSQMTWEGDPVTPGQSLPFPRTGLDDRDGNAVSSTIVPQDVINGACELALAIYLNPDKVAGQAQGTASNISEVSATSGTSVSFFRPIAGTRLPTAVDEWLEPYLEGGGTGGTSSGVGGATAFGTDESGHVTCIPNRYRVC
jgi:hypothetical protein